MRVGIMAIFNGVVSNYSIVNVVAEHIRMLLKNNISVRLIVSEQFDDKSKFGIYLDERIEWFKLCNTLQGHQIIWKDYSNYETPLHESFFDEVDVIKDSLKEAFTDLDVVIMHDILYQGWHYVHNVAVRLVQKDFPNLRFIAFTHSYPSNRPLKLLDHSKYRFVPMPNTSYVYPSYSGLEALAKQYAVPEGICHVIYNSLNPLENMSTATLDLNSKVNLLDTDILIVYPSRLTPGKQFEKIAALAGAIQTVTEKTCKVIFCDFDSMDIEPDEYRFAIKTVGESFGLENKNIIFTSQYGYKDGFPRESVLELFTLSNLYICPSKSESFGLTVIEAASRGNFLVLNKNVPALEELGKKLKAYFMEWDARNCGFDIKTKHQPNEASYYAHHAKKIVDLMRDDNVLNSKMLIRTRYSDDWIFKNQLEPLLKGNL